MGRREGKKGIKKREERERIVKNVTEDNKGRKRKENNSQKWKR